MPDDRPQSIDPFDRSTYTPRNPGALSPEEQWAAQLEDVRDQGRLHAEMALAFLAHLEGRLTHEEALYLTAQVWRAS